MREVAKIQQKHTQKSLFGLLFVSALMMLYSVIYPAETGEMIRKSAILFAEKVFPSLFAFSVCAKMLVKSGICKKLEKTPIRHLFSLFSVSFGGFSALLLGFLSGFPVGAHILSDLLEKGEIQRKEAENLLPFCNNAGASFVIGTVGVTVFDSARVGRYLFFAQIAAALLAVSLTAGRRKETLSSSKFDEKTPASVSAVFTSAISESALAMISVCGYVVFFSVLTGIFLRIFRGFLPFSDVFFAFFTGVFELSGGVFLLSEATFPTLGKLVLCGALLGFGGISVFLQVADRAEKATLPLSFYLKGKCMTMMFSAGFAPLFCFLGEKSFGFFWICMIFTGIFTINLIKNKIIFQKSVEKRKGMLYNRNEIHCP